MTSLANLTLTIYKAADRSSTASGRRTLGQIAEAVRGDSLKEVTEKYRTITEKKIARSFKASQFPAITVSGVVPDPRMDSWPITHSGLYQWDIDEINDPIKAELFLKEIRKLPYAVMAFKSPSYNVKAILRGPQPYQPKKESQWAMWEGITRAAANDIGIHWEDADLSVKSVNGLCFLSNDPEVYYNPDAAPWIAPIPIAAEAKPETKGSPAPTSANLSEHDIDLTAAKFIPCPGTAGDPNYKNWLGWARTLYSLDFSWAEIAEWCSTGTTTDCGNAAAIEERIHRAKKDPQQEARNKLRGAAYKAGWRNQQSYEVYADAQRVLEDTESPHHGNAFFRAGHWIGENHLKTSFRLDIETDTGFWRYHHDSGVWSMLTKDGHILYDAVVKDQLLYAAEMLSKGIPEHEILAKDSKFRKCAAERSPFWAGLRFSIAGHQPTPNRTHLNTPDGVVDTTKGLLLGQGPEYESRACTKGRYRPEDYDYLVEKLRRHFAKVLTPQMLEQVTSWYALAMAGKAQDHRTILMITGASGSGKGGILNACGEAAGSYHLPVDPDWFQQRNSDIDAITATILERKILLLTIDEIGDDAGQKLSPKRVLSSTGGMPKTARKPYGSNITDYLQCGIMTACVNPPSFPSGTGIERRLGVVPTTGQMKESDVIPEHYKDQDILDALITIAVTKCLTDCIHDAGYVGPAGDAEARQELLDEMDPVQAAIEDLPDHSEGLAVTDLTESLREELGMKRLSTTAVGKRLRTSRRWTKARGGNPKLTRIYRR